MAFYLEEEDDDGESSFQSWALSECMHVNKHKDHVESYYIF